MPSPYLVDSNVLISAHRVHYPFSTRIFHPFWQTLEQAASDGKLLMLDVVYDELVPKHTPINERDLLAQWTEAVFRDTILNRKTDAIFATYAEVQDYLVACKCYQPAAVNLWSAESKADPWLIAAAKVHGAIIVTDEGMDRPTPKQPIKKEPKIPDVASALGVRTCTTRQLLDDTRLFKASAYPIQSSF
ncbi:DUF4411 family protein [Bifidobacterium pseudolongum]|uniref:PIN domain-containing protein n=1 Tax=Bifidobacterium pseudolongum subsp. globosum TaxID=1690 RepID=A0A2N3R7R6_9BIFI|nr:DUF4411 family protein [Bifidobacterium pseudolongum]PKV05398.1 PIN domain-containing protein [Bifidobacterium pseudolongum subsp. globosum]